MGPNNSGKSLVLREIESAIDAYEFPKDLRILGNFEIDWYKITQSLDKLIESEKISLELNPDHYINISKIGPNGSKSYVQVDLKPLKQVIDEKTQKGWISSQYLTYGMLRLDGRSRFNLTNDQPAGDQLSSPTNILSHIFQNDDTRRKIREVIFDAFSLHFVIDPTKLGSLRIRLSTSPPLEDEQSLNQIARNFHAAAQYIGDASDGVQAFTGIITAVLSEEFHTVLIDEPEAFLHPPLARKLGKNLASLANERDGALMASTHSSDFLMGCIQGSQDVRVVRLEYENGQSRGRMIDPAALEGIFRKPLMRSANVISGLFHDGVVVTESDNDRAFYSQIYNMISDNKNDYPSLLFINTQNKQTILDIVGPLRQFGVPSAAIPDIDILKDGGKNWTQWLSSARIPLSLHAVYGMQRASILDEFKKTGKDMKSQGGVDILDSSQKVAAELLFENLQQFGIFVVRRGELESWLKELSIPGKKTDWTIAMLERLWQEPGVVPSSTDVWAFMQMIVDWIRNPSRRGL